MRRINLLRRLVLVNSVLYYVFDQPVVPDHRYDAWARELVDLQTRHPEASSRVEYMADAFKDFDGSVTGFNLPLDDFYARRTALILLGRVQEAVAMTVERDTTT